jgi:hypothetical protein
MTALAGRFAFFAAALPRRVAAQLSAGVLSLALALGSPLCQAAHSGHDGTIDWVADRPSQPLLSVAVGETHEKVGTCCHLSVAREDATGKSLALPQRGFTSALLAPTRVSWTYLVPLVAYAVRSMHRIPPPAPPLARLTDKLVL